MPLIIDTHALIWIGAGSAKFISAAREAVQNPLEQLLVSAVTAWEYVDLAHRGRTPEAAPFEILGEKLHFEILDLPAAVWQVCRQLPHIHRDSIDRMLIAHDIIGDFTLVTADRDMRAYPVRTLW